MLGTVLSILGDLDNREMRVDEEIELSSVGFLAPVTSGQQAHHYAVRLAHANHCRHLDAETW